MMGNCCIADEVFPTSEEHEDEALCPLEVLPDPNGGNPPLEFESFKDQIHLQGALDMSDFQDELDREISLNENFVKSVKERIDKDPDDNESSCEQRGFLQTFVLSLFKPGLEIRYDRQEEEQPYQEAHRSFIGQSQDEFLLLLRGWLKNPIKLKDFLIKNIVLSWDFTSGNHLKVPS